MHPEQERRTQEYFNLMNRGAQTQAEEAFQREEFRNTLNLLNQVDDRHLYFLSFQRTDCSRFKTPPHFHTASTLPHQAANIEAPADLGIFAQALLDQSTSNFRSNRPHPHVQH